MTDKRTVVLGYDLVSPLGTDMETQWKRAVRGESGIGPLTRFPLTDGFPVRIAGQVGDWDASPYPFLSPRRLAQWSSPIFQHAMLVAYRALLKSGVVITPDLAPRTAVTFSSAVGGQDAVLAADRRMIRAGRMPHPFTNPNACINMVGGKISMMTGATGPITATITACATGVTSMLVGKMLLDQNRADLVICGAVDFPLVEPIVAGFYTMNGAYRPREGQFPEVPSMASRPFSSDRRGFVISEGAAAVILASKDFADAHGLPYGIELAGWSMTSDAKHFVAPNFETVRRAISESIENAGIGPGDIACINAHATSTKVGDRVEYDVLKSVFARNIPPVCANKSLTGHCMGASSAIESVLAMEGMQKGTLLPTINYTPDPEMSLDCVAEGSRLLDQEYILKNAFGFGGCNACVVFRKIR